MQPKWLIAQLNEFIYVSQYQRLLSDEMHKSIRLVETYGLEHSSRLDSDVYRCITLLEEIKEQQHERWALFNRRKNETEDTFNKRITELEQVSSTLHNVKVRGIFWDSQLSKAKGWESRARERVADAEASLRSAESNESSAEYCYDAACRAYASASSKTIRVYVGRDRHGNNQYEERPNPAHRERAVMESAKRALSAARTATIVAQSRLSEAHSEHGRAMNQVSGTLNAISDMSSAIRRASLSLSSAEDAKLQTQNSRYSLEHEQSILECMDSVISSIETCIASQKNCQAEVHGNNAYAFGVLRKNEACKDNLSYEVYKSRYAIDNKTALLTAFDAPVFLG